MLSFLNRSFSLLIDDSSKNFQPNKEVYGNGNSTPIQDPDTNRCSSQEKIAADTIKDIHDQVEKVAYQALVDGVKEFGIEKDALTEEQSDQLLNHIKSAAHREMYKSGGYINSRGQLNSSQIQTLVAKVAKIIHDRDTKLTDARYHSLSELLLGLDDHNTMVKVILLSSWFKEPRQDCHHEHLNGIKKSVNFYPQMQSRLDFDLESKLEERKAFWNTYFPGKRESLSNEDATAFVNILEVRDHFGKPTKKSRKPVIFKSRSSKISIGRKDWDKPLASKIPSPSPLFSPSQRPNLVRCSSITKPPLLDEAMTSREFLSKYYPDLKI